MDTIEPIGRIETVLNYLAPMSGRPVNYTFEPPPGIPISNASPDPRTLTVFDLRRLASPPTLDREGFQLVDEPSTVRDFDDEATVRDVYYGEAERIIKEVTGANRVFVFDHTLRRHIPGANDRRAAVPRQPVTRVHVDQTARSGPLRVNRHLPDEADELLARRVAIINLWRPIRGPVLDAPLAICDARSVAPKDLVPADLVYPDRVGETYAVSYNPRHRWFYAPRMTTSEAFLIKCYDSAVDGRARFAPHTAFFDPQSPDDAPPRESIELRTLVFWP